MNKKITQSIFFLSLGFVFTFGVTSDNGKAGVTGSPGENTCTNCHSGTAVNAGGGSITITSSNLTNWEYTPGQTYNLTVTVSETGKSLFGLGVEALQSSGANGGTLNAGTGTSIKTATVSGNSRRNVVHNLNAGTGTGSHAFSFTWAAPTSNIGNVTLYTAGIAANGNGSDTGDHVYKTSQVVTPAASTGIQEEVIANSWKAVVLRDQNQLNIAGGSSVAGKMNVQVFNLQGQVVWTEQNIQVPAGSIAHWMDISNLSSEMYIIQVTVNGQKVLSQQFVK
jgi:Secretion system C-terminal sorting domain/Reeler domain